MHLNHVWILVAALVQWLLGAFWYGVIFKKSWKKLLGQTEGEKPKNSVFAMAMFFVANLVLAYVLAHILSWAGARTLSAGFKLGVICWLGFMAPPLFAQHVFEGRRVNLFAINAAYWILAMGIGGAILAQFH
jgi:MFS family permease